MNRYGIFNAEAFYDLYVISKHLLLCSIFNEINVTLYFICVCMCGNVCWKMHMKFHLNFRSHFDLKTGKENNFVS